MWGSLSTTNSKNHMWDKKKKKKNKSVGQFYVCQDLSWAQNDSLLCVTQFLLALVPALIMFWLVDYLMKKNSGKSPHRMIGTRKTRGEPGRAALLTSLCWKTQRCWDATHRNVEGFRDGESLQGRFQGPPIGGRKFWKGRKFLLVTNQIWSLQVSYLVSSDRRTKWRNKKKIKT